MEEGPTLMELREAQRAYLYKTKYNFKAGGNGAWWTGLLLGGISLYGGHFISWRAAGLTFVEESIRRASLHGRSPLCGGTRTARAIARERGLALWRGCSEEEKMMPFMGPEHPLEPQGSLLANNLNEKPTNMPQNAYAQVTRIGGGVVLRDCRHLLFVIGCVGLSTLGGGGSSILFAVNHEKQAPLFPNGVECEKLDALLAEVSLLELWWALDHQESPEVEEVSDLERDIMGWQVVDAKGRCPSQVVLDLGDRTKGRHMVVAKGR
ncbi:hypothetical protein Acr_10g0006590 [Actinidia rufa]|uniref:Uncharacterized protein n=1 Tax=Actinidia rufa TaxID=165716 RepID=A0A7J0F991_9ERIC|nr:hypothetical protein Acr_10g0006590 [Actinidia rufa]